MTVKAVVLAPSYDIFKCFIQCNMYNWREYRYIGSFIELYGCERDMPVIRIEGWRPPKTRTDQFYLNRMTNQTDWSFESLKGKRV